MGGLFLLVVVTLAYTQCIEQCETFSARGYNRRVAIPLGEEIRKQEEAFFSRALTRIVGGLNSDQGELPYQAGVLTAFIGLNGTGICGGSLVSANKVIHAAHCWFDGEAQGLLSVIVLGSTFLFFGGIRQSTADVITYPEWNPGLVHNDVAVISLPNPVQFSNTIKPINLPSGSQLNETFAGEVAVASGYGLTNDTNGGAITKLQALSHVNLTVITNDACFEYYPKNVIDSNICTSGSGGISTCRGDSGGPLAATRNGEPVLIGITSFGSFTGCQLGYPAAYARVSSFMSFFNQHL